MAEMSPVELLRAAAAEVRKRGDATATDAPWRAVPDDLTEDDTAVGVWSPDETFVFEDSDTMLVDAEWIALMHPGLAEPLAALLEEALPYARLPRWETFPVAVRAVAVARVLLGVPDGR